MKTTLYRNKDQKQFEKTPSRKQMGFSGWVIFHGTGSRIQVTVPPSKPDWMLVHRGGVATFTANPPPDPQDPNTVYVYLPNTYGDFHAWF